MTRDQLGDFDAAIGKMGNGIRRAQAGYTDADEGFRRAHEGFSEADAGFIEALEALKAVTLAKGTLDERFTEMRETIARIEAMLLAQNADLQTTRADLQTTRAELQTTRAELRSVRERLGGF